MRDVGAVIQKAALLTQFKVAWTALDEREAKSLAEIRIERGRMLSEVRPRVAHGQWLPLLADLRINDQTARNYMAAYEADKSQKLRDLDGPRPGPAGIVKPPLATLPKLTAEQAADEKARRKADEAQALAEGRAQQARSGKVNPPVEHHAAPVVERREPVRVVVDRSATASTADAVDDAAGEDVPTIAIEPAPAAPVVAIVPVAGPVARPPVVQGEFLPVPFAEVRQMAEQVRRSAVALASAAAALRVLIVEHRLSLSGLDVAQVNDAISRARSAVAELPALSEATS